MEGRLLRPLVSGDTRRRERAAWLLAENIGWGLSRLRKAIGVGDALTRYLALKAMTEVNVAKDFPALRSDLRRLARPFLSDDDLAVRTAARCLIQSSKHTSA